MITEFIPTGHVNAITRRELVILTGLNDREVRDQINAARRETVILNLQDGKGYFLPGDGEEGLVDQFVRQEEKRAKSIFYALKPARDFRKERNDG